ncbi:hypothetical protein DPM19_00740 [Actinomadura craniellae]|uniref:Uncharacterized protein n=1 Tax=Actinomadura craniellae TaxID=2231787 RepID=A0A365HCJ6_9ACTN|nr:hypothetical protein [Actinomadura craniellae]RAY16732.1 hypothetical protein DPM19_00740 [Actinomadura craniellae]
MSLLITIAAVFLAGIAVGAFALIVIGIHAEERRASRTDADDRSPCGTASHRLLSSGLADQGRR